MVRFKYSAINNTDGCCRFSNDDEGWSKLVAAGWIVTRYPFDNSSGGVSGTAERSVPSARAGLEAWEATTGESPWASGCQYPSCQMCLPPHKFSYEDKRGHHKVRRPNTERR